MNKLKTLARRIRSMSFKRYFFYAGRASRESGRFMLSVLFDMFLCAFRYGVGYLDYYIFGFARITKDSDRRTFMTMPDNLNLFKLVNDEKATEIFENKDRFDRVFSEYLGRSFLDLDECSEEQFCRFCDGKGRFFAKITDAFGGLGVKAVTVPETDEDRKKLFSGLREEHYGLAEEEIRQHSAMSSLCSRSVNTLRMTTLIGKDGAPHLMYVLIRIGRGNADVDNITSGGMYSQIDIEEGVIRAPAFCDKTGDVYYKHPVSGTEIVGFRIPYFEEAKALVLKAALKVPEVRYVGWDVAITENGPVFVEGNTIPGYDMCQNYRHLPKNNKTGVLPKFREVLGCDF